VVAVMAGLFALMWRDWRSMGGVGQCARLARSAQRIDCRWGRGGVNVPMGG